MILWAIFCALKLLLTLSRSEKKVRRARGRLTLEPRSGRKDLVIVHADAPPDGTDFDWPLPGPQVNHTLGDSSQDNNVC